MPTNINDIENSERLLDLSNQLLDSLTQRRKTIKDIDSDEKLYLTTVKQQQRLSQDIAANAEKYLSYQIKSKDLANQIKANDLSKQKSTNAFKDIEQKLINQRRQSLNEAISLRNKESDIKKQILTLDLANDSLLQQRNKLLSQGRNINSSDVQNFQQQIKENQTLLKIKERQVKNFQTEGQKQKDIAKSTYEIIKNAKEAEESQKKEIAFLIENLRIRKQIEKSTGLLGGITKAASKIPGIGQYLNADEAIDEMEKLAASIEKDGGKATSFGNRMQIAGKGLQVLVKGAYENLKSPEAVFTFFLKAALAANDQSVKLGKSLGYGADRADAFRENLAGIERSSSNLNVTTKNLVEAFSELATATGFAYEFSADQLETQIKLTKQVGLTADEAAQVQRFGILTGKTSEETYRSFVKGLVATRNQLKVSIDFKATLAEAVKVSGQLAAQLGYNPERIAKAIVTAKAFGMTLEQVAKSGESLLNFETSIESELKAELLTGKQLNLERARAAALSGDQATVAAEIAKNVGTAADFAKMNTLEQKALAEAVGMTADELSNTLRKREEALASGKSLVQINEEEAAQALERQTIQDKFNAAILKLQSLIGNLVAGPLAMFIDGLSTVFQIVNFIIKPLQWLGELSSFIGKTISGWSEALGPFGILLKGVAGIAILLAGYGAFAALSWIPIVGPALGAIAAAAVIGKGFSALNSQKADDMVSEGGYGKRTLLSPEGAIKLNDKDTVIAGTDLGSNSGNERISPSIDLTPMIAAINEVKAEISRLANRPIEINLDGKKVGSGLTQGSYKFA